MNDRIDRSTFAGFKNYWSARPGYFQEVYHRPFDPATARAAFRDAMAINWPLLGRRLTQ